MSSVGKLMFQVGIQEVDKKIADVKRAFDAFDEKYGKGINIKVQLNGAEDLINKLSAIGDPKKLKAYQDEIDKLKKQLSELKDAAEKATSGGGSRESNRISNLDKLHVAIEKVNASIESLSSKREAASGLGIDVSKLDAKIAKLTEYREELKRVEREVDLSKSGALKGLTFGGEQLLGGMNKNSYLITAQNEVKALLADFERLIKAKQKFDDTSATSGRAGGSLAAHMGEEVKRTSSELEKLREKYERLMIGLSRGFDALAQNRRAGKALNLELPDISKIVTQIRELHSELSRGRAGGSPITTKMIEDAKTLIEVLRQLNNEQRKSNASANTSEIHKNTQAKQQNVDATRQQIMAEQSFSQALHQSSQSLISHSSILQDLKSLATQYLGVWGGQQFLNNIIQIGGQLEMQRLSIGAILQNTAQANTLFEQIKGLAVKSPFGVVELDQMTKQLTAYGFKYNELFDMTKRLADISAATGTDVSRLALALGHVRSEAALSGYTLRQFSMANVPLLQKLSEKLGKTSGEIRKMVKSKQISYEDVLEVLKGLTDEGGMFYNMQEVMSQSVKAKFKNVKDAMDIMYGEMAESSVIGEPLKNIADILMTLTRNWRQVGTALATVAVAWGVQRMAILATTKALGAGNAAILSTITSLRAQRINTLTTAQSYRTLTASEEVELAVSKRLNASWWQRRASLVSMTAAQRVQIAAERQQIITGNALALTSGRIRMEDILRQVSLGKLTKAQAKQIFQTAELTAVERTNAMTALTTTRVYTGLGRALFVSANAVTSFGRALKSLIFNPATLITGALMGVMELWQHISGEMDKAKTFADNLYNQGEEGLKNTREMFAQTGIQVFDRKSHKDVSGSFGEFGGGDYIFTIPPVDTTDAKASIDAWIQYIKDYAATPNQIINEALYDQEGNVRSLKDQYYELGQAVTAVAAAQAHLKEISGMSDAAMGATFGSLDDSVLTNVKEWDEEVTKYVGYGAKLWATGSEEWKKGAANIIDSVKELSPWFKEVTADMSSYSEQWMYLIEHISNFNTDTQLEIMRLFESQWGTDSWDWMTTPNLTDALTDFQTFCDTLEVMLPNSLKNGSEEARQTLILLFNKLMEEAQVRSPYVRKTLERIFSKKFNVSFDIDKEGKVPKQINEVERMLSETINKDWKIDLSVATNVDDAIKDVRQKYKAACDYFANIQPMLAKFKINVQLGDVLGESEIEKVVSGLPEEAQASVRKTLLGLNQMSTAYNNAVAYHNTTGISLKDPNPGGKVFKEGKNKNKTGSKGSQTDKALKGWEEEYDEIKRFYSEYKKYLDFYYTEEKALAEMQKKEAFGSFFVNGKNIYDPNKIWEALDDLYNKTSGGTPERDKFRNKIIQERADFVLDASKEEVERAANEMKEYISQNADKFNLYKLLSEKVGKNSALADMAFLNGKVWDNVSEEFAKKLSEMMGGQEIDFNMNEEEAKKFFQENKAALELWKKIVEITRNNYVDALKKAADAQEKLMTNEELISIKQQKVLELEREQESGIDHTKEIEQLNEEIAKLESELFELLPVYEEIFGEKSYRSYRNIVNAEKKARQLVKNITIGQKNAKTGKVDYYRSFYMDGEERKQVQLSAQQLEKLKKVLDKFHKDETKKDPFKSLYKDIKNLWKVLKDKDATKEDRFEAFSKFGESLNATIPIVASFTGELGKLFETLGDSKTADNLNMATSVFKGIGNIIQGFINGGETGAIIAAAGEVLKIVTALIEMHDKYIEADLKVFNWYKNYEDWLKSINEREIERSLTGIYGAINNFSKYQEKNKGNIWEDSILPIEEFSMYENMLEETEQQLKWLEKSYDEAKDKKNRDADKELDLQKEIEELKDSIAHFAEDLAKTLYDIDVKSWAKDLTDAVVDAWAQGEDAAEAWHKKVNDLVKDVTKNILAQKVVGMYMQPVLDKVVAEMEAKKGKLDAETIVGLASELKEAGENSVGNLVLLLEELKKQGVDLSQEANSASSSSSIKSMTEETADLLLSYVNAIRGDVSVNRELQTKIAANIDLLPTMSVTAQAQLQQLTAISQNTLRNADMAEQIYVLFNGLKTGAWRLEVQ